MHSAYVISTSNSKVVSKGMNSGRASYSGCKYEIHAEMEAMKKIKRNIKKTYDILVIRVTKTGTLGNSRPCSRCKKYILYKCKMSGIQIGKIYYSNDDGSIRCERFSKMENNIVSSRFRQNIR